MKAFQGFLLFPLILSVLCFQTSVAANDSLILRKVDFHGSFKNQIPILFRAMKPIEEGMKIAIDDTTKIQNEIYKLLNNTELFNDIQIEGSVIEAEYYLNIGIWERFPIIPEGDVSFADRNINVWMKERNFDLRRINIGVGATYHNFLGKQQKIGLFLQAGYTPKISVKYENPYLDRQKIHGWGFETSWSANKELVVATDNHKLVFYKNENYFIYHHFEGLLFYQYKPDNILEIQVASGLDWEQFHDEVFENESDFMFPKQNEYWTWKNRLKLSYNKVDHWNYPLTGWRAIMETTFHIPLSNQEFYWPVSAQFDYYLPLSKRWYLSVIQRFNWNINQGGSYPFQQNLGYNQHYIRGFESYVFDGQGFYLARQNLKFLLLDWQYPLSWKYFETIPLKILVKGFADQGVYWDNPLLKPSRYSEQALYSFGLGIDILTLYGLKFRIEYSLNNLYDSGFNFHRSGE